MVHLDIMSPDEFNWPPIIMSTVEVVLSFHVIVYDSFLVVTAEFALAFCLYDNFPLQVMVNVTKEPIFVICTLKSDFCVVT